MPTLRQRHMITETDEIARAIDAAALSWPELAGDRAALLRQLIVAGAEATLAVDHARIAARRLAIRRGAGALTGMYPPNAAQLLKDEWPD
jgi:hypothetical protein